MFAKYTNPIVIVALLPNAFAADATVRQVIDGQSLVMDNDKTVRLAGIEAPKLADATHPGEPLAQEAKAALTALVEGRSIRLETLAAQDRHGRVLAQLYRDDGTWVQQALLEKGMAMAYSAQDTQDAPFKAMLAAEEKARKAHRGIWAAPFWRVISPAEAKDFIHRYKIVEGKVTSVHQWHDHIYINFSEHWKGEFALFIAQKKRAAFGNFPLTSLVGNTIRARGWISDHHAPSMDITSPLQIELP